MTKKYLFFVIVLLFNLTLTNASIVVLNGLTHRYIVEHGMLYKGVISIQNTADINQNVRIYLNNYAYKATGEIYYLEPGNGANNRSNALWVDLNVEYLILKPKEKYDLHYEITVPDTTEFDGSYWSLVMIEPVDFITPKDHNEGLNVRSVVRYAIQLITTLNEDTSIASLEFQNVNIVNESGKRFLQVDIINKGDLYHKVTASAEFFESREGTETGLFKSNIQSLLPNNSKRFTIDISSVPTGNYSTVLLADSGDDNLFGLNLEIIIKNE